MPSRTCLACRKKRNKEELLRIVRLPSGETVFDQKGRLNGRGAYLCRNRDCILKAEKSGVLARSLKIKVPESVYQALEEMPFFKGEPS